MANNQNQDDEDKKPSVVDQDPSYQPFDVGYKPFDPMNPNEDEQNEARNRAFKSIRVAHGNKK